jgi:hypothetical protein
VARPERVTDGVEVASEQAPHERMEVRQLGGIRPDDEG